MKLISLGISFTFSEMQFVLAFLKSTVFAVMLLLMTAICSAQPTPTGKSIFFDSDGREVSNNEFVDIRMANFHIKDSTITRILPDGTVEFRLQKVPQEGMRMPEFTVTTLDGKTVNSADLKGKVVVLNFWFIGCPVCLAHKPKLNDLAARFVGQDDVVFLAMTGDSTAAVRKYLDKERFDYRQTANVKSTMDLFTFVGYPKNIVVSRTGEIVYWRSTVKAWDKFESVIREELTKK
jgi:peroxiredoxin